jgi:hypothetical protein
MRQGRRGGTLGLKMLRCSCWSCCWWDGWRKRDLGESVGNRAAFQGIEESD